MLLVIEGGRDGGRERGEGTGFPVKTRNESLEQQVK